MKALRHTRPMKLLKKFVRPWGMNISEYVIKFEQLYFKARFFHMEILDGVWAYRLLNSANPTNEQKLLVKAAVSKIDYQIIKDQLKKVFISTSTNVDKETEVDKTDVKPEENEVFFTSRGKNYRQQNSYSGNQNRNRNKQNLKTNITIKKWTHLIMKKKFHDATFVVRNFVRKKFSKKMLQKNLLMIWLYEQLNICPFRRFSLTISIWDL